MEVKEVIDKISIVINIFVYYINIIISLSHSKTLLHLRVQILLIEFLNHEYTQPLLSYAIAFVGFNSIALSINLMASFDFPCYS